MAYGRQARGRQSPGRCLLAKYYLRLGDREVEAELEETPAGLRVNIDGEWRTVQLHRLGDSPRYVMSLDDRLVEVLVEEEPRGFNLQIEGAAYEVETVRGGRRGRPEHSDSFVEGRWTLRAPLTGVISEVRCAAGDTVSPGDVLLVVEAMKMLNDLRCRVEGVVSVVNVTAGQRVEIGEALAGISEPSA